MIEEIGGKKEREKKFGEFTGLEAAEAWNAHPDTSAVDLCADNRQHGGKQQYQTHHHRHVGKAPENAVISQEDDDQRRKHQSNVQPYDLELGDIPSLALIDAGDHRDAGGGEQQYARHDGLAGIRLEAGGQPTEHEEQCGRRAQHDGVLHGECTGGALEHLDERQRADSHGKQEQRNLAETGSDHCDPPVVASSAAPMPDSDLLVLP